MAWMNESFKSDKRYVALQLKRGKLKLRDVEAILSTLPDVSFKAKPLSVEQDNPNPPETQKSVEETSQEPEEKEE